jgi:hypothetical protein
MAPIIAMTRSRDTDVIFDVENGFPYFLALWRRRPSLCLDLSGEEALAHC